MAATTNDSVIAGPASSAAAWPVSTKMPAPMMTPIPSTTTSSAERSFLSFDPSTWEVAMVSSTVLRRDSSRLAMARALPARGERHAPDRGVAGRGRERLRRAPPFTAVSETAGAPAATVGAMALRTPERTDVGGLPVWWQELDGPFRAALVFRVGQADETLSTRGLTHLVEHLAMHAAGRVRHLANAFVGMTTCVFYGEGARDSVLAHLEAVAAALSDLPLDRLETECAILRAESGNAGSGPLDVLLGLTFGAHSYGLVNYPETVLQDVDASEVRAWTAERFTRENAAVWMTGPPGAMLSALPAGGRRFGAPAVEPLPLALPVQAAVGPAGSVSIGALVPDVAGTSVGLGVLEERVVDDLRSARGLVYSVEANARPLGADHRYVWIGADCEPHRAASVRDQLLDLVRRFVAEGPTEPEVEIIVEGFVDELATFDGACATLDAAAEAELEGREQVPAPELLRRWRALAPADLAAQLRGLADTPAVVVPDRTPPPQEAGWGEARPLAPVPAGGERLSCTRRLGGAIRLADQALVLEPPGEQRPIVLPWGELVLVEHAAFDGLFLLARDGTWISCAPEQFEAGAAAIAAVLARVPGLRVRSTLRAKAAGSLAAATDMVADPVGMGAERHLLADLAVEGERFLHVADVLDARRPALLAVTDRRVLSVTCVAAPPEVLDVPWHELTEVRVRRRLARRPVLTLVMRSTEIPLTWAAPSHHLGTVIATMRERLATGG